MKLRNDSIDLTNRLREYAAKNIKPAIGRNRAIACKQLSGPLQYRKPLRIGAAS